MSWYIFNWAISYAVELMSEALSPTARGSNGVSLRASEPSRLRLTESPPGGFYLYLLKQSRPSPRQIARIHHAHLNVCTLRGAEFRQTFL